MIERIRTHLVDQRGPALALLRRLVDVNSFTENVEGGLRVGAILAEALGAIPSVSVR